MKQNPLSVRSAVREFIGEVTGTFLLVFFGLSANASGLLSGSISGLWQAASVWGFGLSIAIYACGALSGAHFNPVVTISLALFRRHIFNWRGIWYYVLAQFLGAAFAAEAIYLIWDPFLGRYELTHNITRGSPGSFVTASIFGEYFPNPGLNLDVDPISPGRAMLVEALGTFLLVFVIFAFSDKRNKMLYESAGFQSLAPFFIGFTLSVLIVAIAPITQAGFNPIRDFAPRLISCIVGWGREAIPGPKNGFWVYILGPLIGGPLGGLFYEMICGLQHTGSWSATGESHPLLLNEEAV